MIMNILIDENSFSLLCSGSKLFCCYSKQVTKESSFMLIFQFISKFFHLHFFINKITSNWNKIPGNWRFTIFLKEISVENNHFSDCHFFSMYFEVSNSSTDGRDEKLFHCTTLKKEKTGRCESIMSQLVIGHITDSVSFIKFNIHKEPFRICSCQVNNKK